MNVIGSRPTGWWRDRRAAMRELVASLGAFSRSAGQPVTVVFDGRPFELEPGERVEVAFASRPGRNAADDAIAERVEAATDPGALTVVTSDSALARRVRARGAEVVAAGRFRARLDAAGAPSRVKRDGPAVPGGRYPAAFHDWLACAVGGRADPAAAAARELGDPVLSAGVAGHALDYDDTYLPGLAHLSAPSAPAALVLAAGLGRSVGDALAAYAAGFEAMGAVARASHPALYGGGWHPTAVCGGVGAATAAASLLGLDVERHRAAIALALLRAGGLRGAFGSAGKALQVGQAAAAGLAAARLAAAGVEVALDRAARGAGGFEAAFGARYAEPEPGTPAIEANWIKAWPCCLQTHGSIEAAETARSQGAGAEGPVVVTVHPISLQAAPIGPGVRDGTQAKFSIPYLTAFTLLHGPPDVASFRAVDERALGLAERVVVEADTALVESEARLSVGGQEVARVEAALGSPQRPLDERALRAKRSELAGDRLEGALDDLARPAAELLELVA